MIEKYSFEILIIGLLLLIIIFLIALCIHYKKEIKKSEKARLWAENEMLRLHEELLDWQEACFKLEENDHG